MADTLMSLRALEAFEVYDREGNKLGVIDDAMLDIDDSTVRYAVLACGSPLGATKKTIAVPLDALHLDTENECFVLDASESDIRSAEGFDSGSPPERPDPLFARASSSGLAGRPRA